MTFSFAPIISIKFLILFLFNLYFHLYKQIQSIQRTVIYKLTHDIVFIESKRVCDHCLVHETNTIYADLAVVRTVSMSTIMTAVIVATCKYRFKYVNFLIDYRIFFLCNDFKYWNINWMTEYGNDRYKYQIKFKFKFEFNFRCIHKILNIWSGTRSSQINFIWSVLTVIVAAVTISTMITSA